MVTLSDPNKVGAIPDCIEGGFKGDSVMSITSTGGGDSFRITDEGPVGLTGDTMLGEEPGK